MPRMLTLRALCERCEKAEAALWCVAERTAFCVRCDAEGHAQLRPAHKRVPIPPASVLAALCPQCTAAPAAVYSPARATLLCDLCARRARRPAAALAVAPSSKDQEPQQNPDTAVAIGRDVLLRDLPAAETLAFDRMDFSAVCPSDDACQRTEMARLPEFPAHTSALASIDASFDTAVVATCEAAAADDEWIVNHPCQTLGSCQWDAAGALLGSCARMAVQDTRVVDLSYFKTAVPARCRSRTK
jgi:hypothetical protein